MCELLSELGYSVIGPFGKTSDALPVVKASGADLAILDINLGSELAYSLADALLSREVPFLFVTGYSADAIEERFKGVTVLQKPVGRDSLSHALSPLCNRDFRAVTCGPVGLRKWSIALVTLHQPAAEFVRPTPSQLGDCRLRLFDVSLSLWFYFPHVPMLQVLRAIERCPEPMIFNDYAVQDGIVQRAARDVVETIGRGAVLHFGRLRSQRLIEQVAEQPTRSGARSERCLVALLTRMGDRKTFFTELFPYIPPLLPISRRQLDTGASRAPGIRTNIGLYAGRIATIRSVPGSMTTVSSPTRMYEYPRHAGWISITTAGSTAMRTVRGTTVPTERLKFTSLRLMRGALGCLITVSRIRVRCSDDKFALACDCWSHYDPRRLAATEFVCHFAVAWRCFVVLFPAPPCHRWARAGRGHSGIG